MSLQDHQIRQLERSGATFLGFWPKEPGVWGAQIWEHLDGTFTVFRYVGYDGVSTSARTLRDARREAARMTQGKQATYINMTEGIRVRKFRVGIDQWFITRTAEWARHGDVLFWDGRTWTPHAQNAIDAGMVWDSKFEAERAANQFKMTLVPDRLAMVHRVVKAYLDTSSKTQDLLCILLAMLRAQHWMYWNAHWVSQGENFYEHHLLFERLYGEDLEGEIDGLAEKVVGFFGSDAIHPHDQMAIAQQFMDKWCANGNLIERGIASEREFQAALKAAYDAIESYGEMSLGLDDFIMAMASRHETAQYLLQQAGSRVRSASGAPSAEGAFFDNPERREVREFADSGAVTNDPDVGRTPKDAPPTPTEILDEPGAEQFSTLNRYVVETEQPAPGLPEGHDELPKHPVLAAEARLPSGWFTSLEYSGPKEMVWAVMDPALEQAGSIVASLQGGFQAVRHDEDTPIRRGRVLGTATNLKSALALFLR